MWPFDPPAEKKSTDDATDAALLKSMGASPGFKPVALPEPKDEKKQPTQPTIEKEKA